MGVAESSPEHASRDGGVTTPWMGEVERRLEPKPRATQGAVAERPSTPTANPSPLQWRPTVRPPRLGGNRRVGIFATRSPFRPNPIGLSLVKLLSVDLASSRITLRLGGIDLLDGTPVLDIKPYVPYADMAPDARAGFAPDPPGKRVDIDFSTAAQRFLNRMERQWAAHVRSLIQKVLEHDPRPAYLQENPSRREFGMQLYDMNIRWRVDHAQLLITTIELLNDRTQTP